MASLMRRAWARTSAMAVPMLPVLSVRNRMSVRPGSAPGEEEEAFVFAAVALVSKHRAGTDT